MILFSCLTLLSGCGEKDAYKITFSIDGKKTVVEVARGETPVCPEELLSWETSEHFYKVTGWDKEIVPATSNATYTATVGEYGLTVYDVLFMMPDRNVVTVKAHDGELPTPPEGYETDLTQVDKVGTFTGWDPELCAPTAENTQNGKKKLSFTPCYAYETRYYTVTFNVRGAEHTVTVAAYETPVAPVAPPTAYMDTVTGKRYDYYGWDKKIVPATEDTVYTAWYGTEIPILAAKNGAKSILTMTYDRSTENPSQSAWVLNMHDKYGIRGTNMLIVGRMNDSMVQGWKNNVASGTLDLGCLGMQHKSDRIETTQAIYRNEIVEAKYLEERLFPGNTIICFASPYAQLRDFSYKANADGSPDKTQKIYDGGSKKIARDTYFAVRNGETGLNSLDPPCSDEAGGWYNLKVQWFYNTQERGQTDRERAGWIDNAVANGGWLLILAHDFKGNDGDYLSLTQAEGEAFYKHASTYIQSGVMWAATFNEATKYLRERQSTIVTERYENGIVYVQMKIDRTTEDGKEMPQNVFNYPLTVEVEVPAGWETVRYAVKGKFETANVYTRNGVNYAMLNLIPGADGVAVTTPVTRVK